MEEYIDILIKKSAEAESADDTLKFADAANKIAGTWSSVEYLRGETRRRIEQQNRNFDYPNTVDTGGNGIGY